MPSMFRIGLLAALVLTAACRDTTGTKNCSARNACSAGQPCASGTDCSSHVCKGGICQNAGCGDNIKNGDETDVDCGGICNPCADGKVCAKATDCASAVCKNGLCKAAACDDGAKNGRESDIDCGGPTCNPCGDGKHCATAQDCASADCESGLCQAPHCHNDVKDGNETGLDCGGSCAPCVPPGGCARPTDCTTGVCTGGVCQDPTCTDTVQNGDETDVDCGGNCSPCAPPGKCKTGADCTTGVCTGGKCQAPACMDTVQNGAETDVDCGGDCAKCGDGRKCKASSDCTSGVCAGGTCQAPACNDKVKNGDETGLDCGGSCKPCATGGCSRGAECASSVCKSGQCQPPACDDLVQNGDETDVDCGGTACSGCDTGGACGKGADCLSHVCVAGSCRAPTCTDGAKNGDESDVDCGGVTCAKCGTGKRCNGSGDCANGACVGGFCQAPTCFDGLKNGSETDIDCGGGGCAPCQFGQACNGTADCASLTCSASACAYSMHGQIINDTKALFPGDGRQFPSGMTFRISVVGNAAISTDVSADGAGNFFYVLTGVPSGTVTVRAQEYGPGWTLNSEYFQEASRQATSKLTPTRDVAADIHLAWHWVPHTVDGGSTIQTCNGGRQIAFWDALNGRIVYSQPSSMGGVGYTHGAVMVTSDGGKTWQTGTTNMLPDGSPFAPTSGNNFINRHLVLFPDGETEISVDDYGTVARSTDAGATWKRVYGIPRWGGTISPGGLVRGGSNLYLGGDSGGVQGSRDRTSVSRSTDSGATWQTLLDHCGLNDPTVSCSDNNNPGLPLSFAGIDISCGSAGHCITLGASNFITTSDDFATYQVNSTILPGWIGACGWSNSGRVSWLPGLDTAWTVLNKSSCGSPVPTQNVTTDAGATWGGWQSTNLSTSGDFQFADASTAFLLSGNVALSLDAGKTWLDTGPVSYANNASYGGGTAKMFVLDTQHVWVMTVFNGTCNVGSSQYLAQWIQ